MPYSTLEQLTDRHGQRALVALTDRDETPTDAIDTDVVDRAIEDADAVIDGYVGRRYQLPLAAVPALITDLSQAIAIWKLHRFEPPGKVKTDYEDAIRTLRDISSGSIVLDVEGEEPEGTEGGGVRITDRERPLTAANLKGFI